MAFAYQQKVNAFNPIATQGDRANNQPAVYAPENFLTEGEVPVGSFVWRAADNPKCVASTGSGEPLGFMERVLNYVNPDYSVPGTLVIPDKSEVNVAIRGDFYIVADAGASVGAAVYANPATGAPTLTSGELTGWTVATTGDAGDLVIITRR